MKSPSIAQAFALCAAAAFCCYAVDGAVDELVVKTIKSPSPSKCVQKAKAGDHLRVHYVGRLDDENGKEFDASRKRGSTFNFQLGAGQVSKAKAARKQRPILKVRYSTIDTSIQIR